MLKYSKERICWSSVVRESFGTAGQLNISGVQQAENMLEYSKQRTYSGQYENLVELKQFGNMMAQVKYGVRSPKFIWAPCAQLYSLAETPAVPPPAFGLIYEGAIGKRRQTTSLCDPLHDGLQEQADNICTLQVVRCCYITVDFATTTLQNGACTYRCISKQMHYKTPFLHKGYMKRMEFYENYITLFCLEKTNLLTILY